MVVLGGCIATTGSASLAPRPPAFDLNAPREGITTVSVRPAAAMGTETAQDSLDGNVVAALEEQKRVPGHCKVKDRFDRKELLAFEWGRNRLGFDVDGIGYDSVNIEQVQVQYRLRFQDYKTKKERCRYASAFQGLIGSGYNELVARENDTVWQELRDMRGEVEDGMEYVFD